MRTQVKASRARIIALFAGALLAFAMAVAPASGAYADDLVAGGIDDSDANLTAQADSPVTWSRVYGDTALDTMAGIVQAGWSKSDVVVISTIEGYWDALSASSLAGANGAPVLFTDRYLLSSQTKAEIARLGASKAFIVGGPAAVSDNVEGQVKAMGVQTERLWGENAAGTAVAIANAVGTARADTCVIATSAGYWDALTASPYAYNKKAPIYLTNDGGTLDGNVVDAIKAAGYKSAVIAGGSAAVKDSVESQLGSCGISSVKRCWGQNAFETAAELSKWGVNNGGLKWTSLGVATGNGYWDALAGAALCGRNGSVLLLADDSNHTAATAVLSSVKSSVGTARVFGGPAAVSKEAYYYLVDSTNNRIDVGGVWVGKWDLYELEYDDTYYSPSQVALLKYYDYDVYTQLNLDGSASLIVPDASSFGTWVANTSTEGIIMLDGDAVPMTISSNKLTMVEGTARMVFVKS